MSFITRAVKDWALKRIGPFLEAFIKPECLDGDTITITPSGLSLRNIVRVADFATTHRCFAG
jgi:bisphosphoglycerate-dependent phosphoglycerate mutase